MSHFMEPSMHRQDINTLIQNYLLETANECTNILNPSSLFSVSGYAEGAGTVQEKQRRMQQPNTTSPVHIDELEFSPGLRARAGTTEYAQYLQHLRGSPYHLSHIA